VASDLDLVQGEHLKRDPADARNSREGSRLGRRGA
jgi:hypothetical protein